MHRGAEDHLAKLNCRLPGSVKDDSEDPVPSLGASDAQFVGAVRSRNRQVCRSELEVNRLGLSLLGKGNTMEGYAGSGEKHWAMKSSLDKHFSNNLLKGYTTY